MERMKASWDDCTHNKRGLNTYATSAVRKIFEDVDEIKVDVNLQATSQLVSFC